MRRSLASLRSTWQRVTREIQHFIAAKRKVRALHISGINDEMIEHFAQEQYRVRAGKKMRDGTTNYAPPFRWLSTAEYLSMQDKFFDDTKNKPVKTHDQMKRMTQTHEFWSKRELLGRNVFQMKAKALDVPRLLGKERIRTLW
eukprot:gb/GEZJ01004805.1/.p2 GENE.gb/GEZJ01004805.1/~~gb/GEZJ01004805.1/.p2  ORF type:complete len:143 (-),score=20.12 gb/GEZJ01004805.1/:1769-2197(-)